VLIPAFIVSAYFIGAFPHLKLLGMACGKRLRGDLHMELWHQCGKLVGLTGILLDFAKGILVILGGKMLGLDTGVLVLGGLAAVVGQMWPVFYGFNGEKGNTTALGVVGTLTPPLLVIALIPMIAGLLLRTIPHFAQRGMSIDEKLKFNGPPSLSLPLGMAIGFLILPLVAWWRQESLAIILGYAMLFFLITIRRTTADLSLERHDEQPLLKRLINRFLFDRSKI